MEHLVRFTTTEGRDGQHSAETLDDALRFVERLRNGEDIREVRVFRMQEVPIEFRTYYKVELRTPESVPAEPVAETAAPAAKTTPAPAKTEPVADEAKPPLVATVAVATDGDADGNGRRLFGRP